MREAFDIMQYEHLAKAWWQRCDGRLEIDWINAQSLDRRRSLINDLRDLTVIVSHLSITAARSFVLSIAVDQDARDPCSERRTLLESVQRLDGAHPGVVRDICRRVRVTGNAQRSGVQRRRVSTVQRVERTSVAGACQVIDQRIVACCVVIQSARTEEGGHRRSTHE